MPSVMLKALLVFLTPYEKQVVIEFLITSEIFLLLHPTKIHSYQYE